MINEHLPGRSVATFMVYVYIRCDHIFRTENKGIELGEAFSPSYVYMYIRENT